MPNLPSVSPSLSLPYAPSDDTLRVEAFRRIQVLSHQYVFSFFEDVLSGADPDASAELKFKVSQELLNRYLGKPRETIDISSASRILIDV